MKSLLLMIILCICFLSNKLHAQNKSDINKGIRWMRVENNKNVYDSTPMKNKSLTDLNTHAVIFTAYTKVFNITDTNLPKPLLCSEYIGLSKKQIIGKSGLFMDYCMKQECLYQQYNKKIDELKRYDAMLGYKFMNNELMASAAIGLFAHKVVELFLDKNAYNMCKNISYDKVKKEIDEEMAQAANELSQAQEIDIDKPLSGRILSKAEFQTVVSTRADRLISCIENEVDINPNQKKFIVEVTIQNTGKILNARITSGSQSGTRCVFKALQGLTVEPFDGGNYIGKIPFELE